MVSIPAVIGVAGGVQVTQPITCETTTDKNNMKYAFFLY